MIQLSSYLIQKVSIQLFKFRYLFENKKLEFKYLNIVPQQPYTVTEALGREVRNVAIKAFGNSISQPTQLFLNSYSLLPSSWKRQLAYVVLKAVPYRTNTKPKISLTYRRAETTYKPLGFISQRQRPFNRLSEKDPASNMMALMARKSECRLHSTSMLTRVIYPLMVLFVKYARALATCDILKVVPHWTNTKLVISVIYTCVKPLINQLGL